MCDSPELRREMPRGLANSIEKKVERQGIGEGPNHIIMLSIFGNDVKREEDSLRYTDKHRWGRMNRFGKGLCSSAPGFASPFSGVARVELPSAFGSTQPGQSSFRH